MITRSTLVEQLRDYQIRSQRKWAVLTLFSSKPHITSRADVVAALSWAFLFCLLVIFSYVTLHFRYFRLSACIVFLGIILPVYLKVSRQRKLAKKRERRLLLPLSIFSTYLFTRGHTLSIRQSPRLLKTIILPRDRQEIIHWLDQSSGCLTGLGISCEVQYREIKVGAVAGAAVVD